MKKAHNHCGSLLNTTAKTQIITTTALFILFSLGIAARAAFGGSTADTSNGGNVKLTQQSLNAAQNYFKQGNINLDRKNYRDAITDYNKALELSPSDFEYYYHRGLAKFKLNEYQGALGDYNKSLNLAPFFNEPRFRHLLAAIFVSRSTVKVKMGDQKGAADDMNKAIKLDPQHFSIGR